jgi:glycosyltransferase involved in cell wall biosynthesis
VTMTEYVHVNDVCGIGTTIVEELRRRGCSARVVQPRLRAEAVGRVARSRAFLTASRIGTALALRRTTGTDSLLHVHYGMFGALGLVAGRPFVLHFHGSDLVIDDRRRLWHLVHRRAAARALCCLVSTPNLLEVGTELADRLVFLPNPVIVPPLAELPRSPEPVVFFATKLDRYKGLEALLPAALRLASEGVPVRVLGFGAEAERWSAELATLARAGAQIVPRRLPRPAFQRLLSGSSIVVGQLGNGCLTMTELDAMARARPVVGRFAYPDAYPVPPPIASVDRDADAVASVVRELWDDGLAASSLGNAARAWLSTTHAADLVVSRLQEFYATAAEPRTPRLRPAAVEGAR